MEHTYVDRSIFVASQDEFLEKARKNVLRFDIDPFVEVFHMREKVYSMFAPCTHDHGPAWIHLVIGDEKAMLIDTGFGVGDLKGLVNELTGGVPLIVVNTHSDGDHSGGNSQFECIYCHEYEVPKLRRQMNPEHWASLWQHGTMRMC